MPFESSATLRRLSPSAVGLAQSSAHFVVSDALLQVMATTVEVGDATGVPDVQSRIGSLFASVGEPRRWYLPELTLATAPDAAFGFTATQEGADAAGDPFNIATVSFGIEQREPADVAEFRLQNPDVQVDPIPFTSLTATLVLSYKNADGSVSTKEIGGSLTGSPLTFSATLLGPDVLLAFSALTETADVQLRLTGTYGVAVFQPSQPDRSRDHRGRRIRPWEIPWQERLIIPLKPIPPDEPDPVSPEIGVAEVSPEVIRLAAGSEEARIAVAPEEARIAVAPEATRLEVAPQVARFDVASIAANISLAAPASTESRPFVAADGLRAAARRSLVEEASPIGRLRFTPAEAGRMIDVIAILQPEGTWVRTVATESVALSIGDGYGSVSYRPRYLLKKGEESRVIVTTEDLSEFDHRQSEFIELTALGQISDRFPSLRAIYLGRVSGTVIAIPARYGLARTADGVAAACDAVVDPSPASSGCRFHLTFGLSPYVSPADLAGLAHELSQHPELSTIVKRVSVPSRLAPLNSVGLGSASISGLSAGNGAESGTFLVDFDVVDGAVPAIAAVNLLMRQLSATPVPTLIGQLSFALDDAFATPVMSTTVFAFSTTIGEDDLVVVTGEGGKYSLSNAGPVPVRVTSITSQAEGAAPTVTAADVVIPPESVVEGPPVVGAILGVDASLVEPEDGFDKSIGDYMRITVTDVQQLRMTVGVNAAGALAGSIVRLDVTASLRGLPGVALPTMTLTAATSIQQVVWQVPLTGGLLGLPADVTIHVTQADGAERDVSLTHDFAEAPILTLGVEHLQA